MAETKLFVQKAKVAKRMLFNPLFGKACAYVYDCKDRILSKVKLLDCMKFESDGESLVIVPDLSGLDSFKKGKVFVDEGITFDLNNQLWVNKNAYLNINLKENLFELNEVNKLRMSYVKSSMKINDDYRYIVIIFTEILFKSPTFIIKENDRAKDNLEFLLNNLERALLDSGYPTDKTSMNTILGNDFINGLEAENVLVNGQQTSVNPINKNIANIMEAAGREEIIIDPESGEVIEYHNTDTNIHMYKKGGKITVCFSYCKINNVPYYIKLYEKELSKDLKGQHVYLDSKYLTESGFYKLVDEGMWIVPKPEFDKDNKLADDEVMTITHETNDYGNDVFTVNCKQFSSSEEFMQQTIFNSKHFNSMYRRLTDEEHYTDIFTHVDTGIIYYNDLSSKYLYYRDVFGIPYLRTTI